MLQERAVAAAVALAAGASLAPVPRRGPRAARLRRGQPERGDRPGRHREGELIVAFRDGVDEVEMERALRPGRARARAARASAPRVLAQLEPGASVAEAVDASPRCPSVAYAEPNGLVCVEQAATFEPNDRSTATSGT